MALKIKTKKNPDSYLNLVLEFPLASIQTEDQLESAQKMLDRLLTKRKQHRGEKMYLDALGDLVATFEDYYCPIDPPNESAMLTHLIEAKNHSLNVISNETGIPKSILAEILSGKKRMDVNILGLLAKYFQIDPQILKPRKRKTGNGL